MLFVQGPAPLLLQHPPLVRIHIHRLAPVLEIRASPVPVHMHTPPPQLLPGRLVLLVPKAHGPDADAGMRVPWTRAHADGEGHVV